MFKYGMIFSYFHKYIYFKNFCKIFDILNDFKNVLY